MSLQQTLSPKNAFSLLMLLDFDGVILQTNKTMQQLPAMLWHNNKFNSSLLEYTQF